MKKVYVIAHEHIFPHGQTDGQLIGIEATPQDAEEVVKKYKKLPGFCEQPDNFSIEEFEIDKDKLEADSLNI